jgi:outer membrane biogenesis lipoprotein LolB
MRSISSARRAMRAALLPLTLLILTGCATTTASAETDAVACSAFEPIRWSKKDADETIRQVKESDLLGRRAIAALANTSSACRFRAHEIIQKL